MTLEELMQPERQTAEVEPVITTGRLTLRPLVLADAARIAALADDWDVARMTARIPFPYTLVDADAWIGSIGADEFVRGIEHEGELIGACGYVVDEAGAAEIGYWLGRDYWRQGFATEAGRGLVDHCFGAAGFKRLVCCHFVDNPASRRVIDKLGFKLIGPCSGWSEARQSMAPTLRYARNRPWGRYLARRAA